MQYVDSCKQQWQNSFCQNQLNCISKAYILLQKPHALHHNNNQRKNLRFIWYLADRGGFCYNYTSNFCTYLHLKRSIPQIFLPFKNSNSSGLLRLQTIFMQFLQNCQKSMLFKSFLTYSLIDFSFMLLETDSGKSLHLLTTETLM